MKTRVENISPTKAKELLNNTDDHFILLDVRTPGEFSSIRAVNALNIPLSEINTSKIENIKEKKIICICQAGSRGEKAAGMLADLGCNNVYNIDGGTLAWEKSGLPVTYGKKTISLERQVRITAGTLTALGTLAGFLFSPNFLIIPFFVGTGLVFSGITNTCGMAILLGKCPWNSK